MIFSALLFGDQTGLLIEKDRIQLSIDRNTTRDQIESYSKALLKRGINFGVEKVIYDDDKKIKYILIVVDCNEGFKGKSGESFIEGKEDVKVGFYRIYNSGGSPFGMNPLPIE